ncbi:MAG TPA: hypothetical protein VK050_01100 [Flavobacteriaceae bacterium]|nr:hypothetical protein [Flavobacteriaceae bacterium]
MKIIIANAMHSKHATIICGTIAEPAKVQGIGILTRTPEYIQEKTTQTNVVIALDKHRFFRRRP